MDGAPANDDPRPEPPVRPSSEDCCQGGCTHCVFDLYAAAIERYEQRMRAWQQRRDDPALKRPLPRAR